MALSLEARFWPKVVAAHPCDCWLWAAAKNPSGYGLFKVGRHTHPAHRVSWVLANGAIPEGMVICHRCDNRACVNPGHLFLGTQAENVADMVSKGRQRGDYRPGEKCPTSKLTDEIVREIRKRALAGENQRLLGIEFNVSQPTISSIKHRSTWGHL